MNDELSERTKLRERFAVEIAGSRNATESMYCKESRCHAARAVLDFAEALTDEAMKRREEDNTEALEVGADAMKDEYEGGSEFEQVMDEGPEHADRFEE